MLDEPAYLRLAATTEALASGLRDAAGDRPVQVRSVPGLLTVFFSEEPVEDYAGAQRCDTEAYAAGAGSSWPGASTRRRPSSRRGSPSLAHTAEHVERTLEAAAAAWA
jgi:glutamate-1-semialdehyde 2,1-aminomutase